MNLEHWSECVGLLQLVQQVCRGGNLQSGVPDKLLDEVQPLVCDELHGEGDVWGEGAHLLHGPHLILRPALLQGTVDLLGCFRLWEKEYTVVNYLISLSVFMSLHMTSFRKYQLTLLQ